MARITIESKFQGERPFQNLLIALGDRHKALGVVADFWAIAQNYWFPNHDLIPEEVFKSAGLPECLFDPTIGLAERRPEGIYAKGSGDAFAWLFECSSAGKRGAEVKRLKKEGYLKGTLEVPDTSVVPFEASYLSSLKILSTEPKNQPSVGQEGKPLPRVRKGTLVENPVGYFIVCYKQAFKDRYGTDPNIRGKVQGQIKSFLKDTPMERSIQMIQAYLQMDGPRGWFKTKGHDFGTFLENQNPILIALSKGSEASGDWTKFWADMEAKNAAP